MLFRSVGFAYPVRPEVEVLDRLRFDFGHEVADVVAEVRRLADDGVAEVTLLGQPFVKDPDQSMEDILRDWCQTAFGKAAGPMYDYYTAMDRAWTAMPVHKGILGDALSVNQFFLSDKLREEAAAAFAAAHHALRTTEDGVARQRGLAALQRERILFKQWQDLYQTENAGTARLNLPLLPQTADFAQSSCRTPRFGDKRPWQWQEIR